MSVKIRLARHGRKKAPYYRMVVADARYPRDGRFVEILGVYQPLNKDEATQIKVDETKALKWLSEGAQPSDTCRSLLRKLGIMKKFHDQRVAAKTAKTAEPAKPAEASAPVQPAAADPAEGSQA